MRRLILAEKISVLMPVYNTEEKFLREAIESILNQTFTDFEFIIINDGSTNNAEDVICSYNDERIKYIKNEQNIGVSASANLGLNEAKGKYIARMDSDDVSTKERLETQYKFLEENPQYQLCSTRISKAKGNPSPRSMNFEYLKAKLMFRGNPIIQPTVMFNKEFFIKNSLYYSTIPYGEDWDLWFSLSLVGKFVVLPNKLLFYRQHPNQANKTYEKRHYEFCKKHFEKSFKILGFEFNEETKELLLNFLVDLESEKISFEQWKALILELKRLLEFVKESKKVSYKYSIAILFKKMLSYSRKTLVSYLQIKCPQKILQWVTIK